MVFRENEWFGERDVTSQGLLRDITTIVGGYKHKRLLSTVDAESLRVLSGACAEAPVNHFPVLKTAFVLRFSTFYASNKNELHNLPYTVFDSEEGLALEQHYHALQREGALAKGLFSKFRFVLSRASREQQGEEGLHHKVSRCINFILKNLHVHADAHDLMRDILLVTAPLDSFISDTPPRMGSMNFLTSNKVRYFIEDLTEQLRGYRIEGHPDYNGNYPIHSATVLDALVSARITLDYNYLDNKPISVSDWRRLH